MGQVSDYPSLRQAVVDWTHRQDLDQGLYIDYFIQNAQLKIAKDVIRENFGNGIRVMEVAMQPQTIQGGTIPVPADWFAPKDFQVSNDAGQFGLTFKAAAWIYERYPIREPQGVPAYIARDLIPAAAFTASVGGIFQGEGVLSVTDVSSGMLTAGMPYTGPGISAGATIIGSISGIPGGAGLYSVSNLNDAANSEPMTGGGEVFIFGPYPDGPYGVQGTYYSVGAPLSDSNPTNWMVLLCPDLLHAACMVEAAKFLKDMALMQTWAPVYQDGIDLLVQADRGERFAGPLAIELG